MASLVVDIERVTRQKLEDGAITEEEFNIIVGCHRLASVDMDEVPSPLPDGPAMQDIGESTMRQLSIGQISLQQAREIISAHHRRPSSSEDDPLHDITHLFGPTYEPDSPGNERRSEPPLAEELDPRIEAGLLEYSEQICELNEMQAKASKELKELKAAVEELEETVTRMAAEQEECQRRLEPLEQAKTRGRILAQKLDDAASGKEPRRILEAAWTRTKATIRTLTMQLNSVTLEERLCKADLPQLEVSLFRAKELHRSKKLEWETQIAEKRTVVQSSFQQLEALSNELHMKDAKKGDEKNAMTNDMEEAAALEEARLGSAHEGGGTSQPAAAGSDAAVQHESSTGGSSSRRRSARPEAIPGEEARGAAPAAEDEVVADADGGERAPPCSSQEGELPAG
eukprot:CAMPEP_0118979032 /NCGR_PEP_ID=MMETSP1173-20130426/25023_1 /TAXON_ID=1034831 /ORGANISM="Rhizochromulina marina cf, Strain CCMP1243" /LENGTH=398 /DNA_ID=CAMNT_0006929273 /DNA_START=17 /DNA_END=1213 /DNA_ORIENTATION=+